MKIWRLKCSLDEEYKSYQLKNLEKSFFKEFCRKTRNGTKLVGEYDNVEIEAVDGNIDNDLAYFWAGGNLILSNQKAKEYLEDLISDTTEFVPLKCENAVLYMMNIVSIIDAADYKNCIFEKIESDLAVGFEKYAFISEKIKGVNIFKIMLNGRVFSTETFVSTEFKERVEQNHLTGFEFIEVWDSDSM